MEINTILAEQFAACSRQKNWFATLQSSLEGLTLKEASWKPGNTSNSILQIVNHLIYWNERHLLKFQGKELEKMAGNNDSTFEPVIEVKTEADWQKMIAKANAVMNEFEEAVRNADEQKLESNLSPSNKVNWLSIITNGTIHNAYHIGQIVLIRKLQESWAKENGVD